MAVAGEAVLHKLVLAISYVKRVDLLYSRCLVAAGVQMAPITPITP